MVSHEAAGLVCTVCVLCTGKIISKLLSMARQIAPPSLSQQAFRYLYLLSKVRGPKVLLRWFSHEVADLEPVLGLLEHQDSAHHQVCGPLSIIPEATLSTLAHVLSYMYTLVSMCPGTADVGDTLHSAPVALHHCHGSI